MKLIKLLFSYFGKINRAQFWLGFILYLSLPFIIFLVLSAGEIIAAINGNSPAPLPNVAIREICSIVIVIWTIITLTCICSKRFHDIGASGWLSLLIFVPYVNLLVLIFLGSAPGHTGQHRYRSLLFSYSGRITRSKFWLGMILYLTIPLLLFAISGAAEVMEAMHPGTNSLAFLTTAATKAIFTILILVWTIYTLTCLGSKRFHDLGVTGWLSILMLIPLVNFVLIVALGSVPGTAGTNKYGAE